MFENQTHVLIRSYDRDEKKLCIQCKCKIIKDCKTLVNDNFKRMHKDNAFIYFFDFDNCIDKTIDETTFDIRH